MNVATENPTELREALALALLRDGAFLTRDSDHPLVVTRGKERGFKLQLHETTPDAPLSPYFFNIRVAENPTKPGTLTQETVRLAAECMYRLASFPIELHYHCITGIPNAGDPIAAEFATFDPSKPRFKLLKGEHGGKRTIEGFERDAPSRGSTILVLDDLINKAGSKFLAVDVMVAKYLLRVKDFVVIVDREQGGREELSLHGISLHSIFKTTELLYMYHDLGYITHELYRDILSYIEASTK